MSTSNAPDCQSPSLCGGPAPSQGLRRCGACGKVYYCGVSCQKRSWPAHKAACKESQRQKAAEEVALQKEIDDDPELKAIRASHAAFSAVVEKYGLKEDEKASEISEFLTGAESDGSFDSKVFSSEKFAERFGMTHEVRKNCALSFFVAFVVYFMCAFLFCLCRGSSRDAREARRGLLFACATWLHIATSHATHPQRVSFRSGVSF
jgi:MYND finger